MRHVGLLVALLLVASAARGLGAATPPGRESATLSRTVAWDGRQELVVDSSVGDVRVSGSERGDILVAVRVDAPTSDLLGRAPIVIEPRPGAVLVRVRQEENGTDARIRSTVTIEAPRGIAIRSLAAFEGQVTVDRILGGVAAVVQRGGLSATALAGRIRLETNSGALQLRQVVPAAVAAVHLRTFNGDVRLTFATPPTDARLLLLTLSGTVSSALPVAERAGFGPRFGEATIGTGEPVYSVDVVRGDIHVGVEGR